MLEYTFTGIQARILHSKLASTISNPFVRTNAAQQGKFQMLSFELGSRLRRAQRFKRTTCINNFVPQTNIWNFIRLL